MRTAFGLFIWLLIPLALIGGPVAAIVFGVENQPLVRQSATLTPEDIERGHLLLERYDPRRMKADEITTVYAREDELNSALMGGLSAFRAINGRVAVERGKVDLIATLELPRSIRWMGRYLNLSAAISPSPHGLKVSRFGVGRIDLSPTLAVPAFQIAFEALVGPGGGEHIMGSIRSVDVLGKTVAIGYRPAAGKSGYRRKAFREARGGVDTRIAEVEYGAPADPGSQYLLDGPSSSRGDYMGGIVEPLGRQLKFGLHDRGSTN